jgi:hypothetical protein
MPLSEEHPAELYDDEGHEDAGSVLEECVGTLLVTPDMFDGGRDEHHDGYDSDDDAGDVRGVHTEILQLSLEGDGNGIDILVLCGGRSGEEDSLHKKYCR